MRSLTTRFIKAVQFCDSSDGWDFSQKYSVHDLGGSYIIIYGTGSLAGIFHPDKQVMEALMTRAGENYGR